MMFDPNHGPRDIGIANELAKLLDNGESRPSLKDNLRHVIQIISTFRLAISGHFRTFGQRISNLLDSKQNSTILNHFVVEDCDE